MMINDVLSPSPGRCGSEISPYVVRSGLDLCIKSMLVFVPERRITDEQDVEDDSAGPDVDRLSIRLLL